jgi:hypothetical protein
VASDPFLFSFGELALLPLPWYSANPDVSLALLVGFFQAGLLLLLLLLPAVFAHSHL